MIDINKLAEEIIKEAQTEESMKLADEAIESYKQNMPLVELKEADIFQALNASYIAQRFFGKSRFWISQKINHNIKNGKPDDFTAEQRKTLKEALETIAFELQTLADDM